MFSSIIIFLVMICILILVHELGHYFVARHFGIVAERFFIGFGPTIYSFNKWGTEFCIKCLPLGGACVFEETKEQVGVDDEGEPVYAVRDSLSKISVFPRMAIVLAGPFANFILAFFLCIFIVFGSYADRPVIQGVIDGFPAMQAGMQAGDKLISIDKERIYLSRELNLWLQLNLGKPLNLVYERDGERHSVSLLPQKDEETGKLLYGFQGHAEYFKPNILQSVQYGLYELRFNVLSTIKGLKLMLTGGVKSDDVTGIVGMAVMVDTVKNETIQYGIFNVILNLVNMAALISVNLGIMNLIPIPALDGGRILFMIVEIIRGKPVPPEKEGYVHLAGFVVLFFLGILIMYNDFARILKGTM